jgi:hypothetical protein
MGGGAMLLWGHGPVFLMMSCQVVAWRVFACVGMLPKAMAGTFRRRVEGCVHSMMVMTLAC